MKDHQLLGSRLSPFSVKCELLLQHTRVPFRVLPQQAGFFENLLVQAKRFALTRGLTTLTYPALGKMGELPLAPYVFGPAGEKYYDSSAIGVWFHDHRALYAGVPLLPEDPRLAFLVHLIDEFIDELGLYVLHHQRWVASALGSNATPKVRSEYKTLLPMFISGQLAERWFAPRQVRRLPYLFSVAPEGFSVAGVPPHRQPPSRAGFPETHTLLDALRQRLNDSLVAVLERQPFLFGRVFTLADASVGGMVCSPLDCDPATAASLAARWPTLHAYATHLPAARPEAVVPASDTLPTELIELAIEAFLPFLKANHDAYERHGRPTAKEANERAYWRGDKLFESTLLGFPYRTVVKTFQVAVLDGLRARYRALDAPARLALEQRFPTLGAAVG